MAMSFSRSARGFTVFALVACGSTGDTDEPFVPSDPTDDDADGLADALEDHLMKRFGPELRLAPDADDGARPANVEWYLERVHMRFHHDNCPDHEVLARGAVTTDSIHAQQHYTSGSLCSHANGPADLRHSNQRATEFFLQAVDDEATHPGIPPARMAEWEAYIQVRPSSYVRPSDRLAATYDLQVWYFFPYNDNIASANHEADWEHLTISISREETIVSVYFASHEAGHRFDDLAQLTFVEDTHVVGYVADGSHATYESAGDHPGPVVDDHCYEGGPAWRTWERFGNLGQIDHVLGGRDWARYGGRWGEIGETSFTTGPVGPMFNAKWDPAMEQ
jgi:hypothetical protein